VRNADRHDQDIRDEIRFYLEERERELRCAGMSAEDARKSARAAFGDPERIIEQTARAHSAQTKHTSSGIASHKDAIARDVRYALRTLRRNFGFAIVVVLTLAVGVGINTAAFGVLRSVLLQPLPYHEPDRLAMLWTDIPDQRVRESPSAFANVRDWQSQNEVFDDLATFDPTSLTLTDGDWAEQVSAARVSSNLFSLLGIEPAIGRMFSAQEDRERLPVVVLSHGQSLRRFGRASAAIDQTIEIAGTRFQVIGVMAEGFGFPERDTELWLPQTWFTDWDATLVQRGSGAWRVVGRLRPGVTLQQARQEMTLIADRLEESHPAENGGLGLNIVSLHDQVTGYSFRLALWTLFGAVGLVLVIACSNVVHLLLVRSLDRAEEFAIRVALGATTSRLVRQVLIECLVLTSVAAIAGLLLAAGVVNLFSILAPANVPRLHEIGIDATMLLYGVLVSLGAGVLCGIAPVVGYSRAAPNNVLSQGRAPSSRVRRHGLRRVLISLQLVLTIILVFGANLLIRSFVEAGNVDPGFQTEDIFMANLSVASEYRRISFYEQVVQEVRGIPGAQSVGIVEDLFISGAPNRAITVEGSGDVQPAFVEIRIDAIAGDFFQTIGVNYRAGRGFAQSDDADAPAVAVVNETMARRFWPGGNPIGRRFRTGGPDSDAPWIEVVGVVGDMYRQGPEKEPIPQVFRPYVQEPSRNMVLLIRADRLAQDLASTVRTRIAGIDRTVPLYAITTPAQVVDRYLVQRRLQTFLLGFLSAIALLLAAVGIYGLLQDAVVQRTTEIGVRIALGAVYGQVMSMIARQALIVVLPGLTAGIVCALWLSDAITPLLFDVAAFDATNIVATSVILLLTALLACYLPARRAARVDPMTVLRRADGR
jgi:putative ABC transport system permease protein